MKLCKSMVAPERGPLGGLVEIDETTIALRTKADPPAGGQGRSHEGKLLLAGAVEITQHGKAKPKLGRIRLASIADFSAASLHAFIAANVAPVSPKPMVGRVMLAHRMLPTSPM